MKNNDSLLIRKYINLMESINKKIINEINLEEESTLNEGREQAFKDLLMTFAKTETEALAIFKNNPLFKNAKSIDDVKSILEKAKPTELKSIMKDFIPKLQGSNLKKLLNSIKSSPAFKNNITKAIGLSKTNPEVMREIGQYYRDMGIEGKQLTNMMAEVSGKPVKEIETLMNKAVADASKATGQISKVTGDSSKLTGASNEVQASMKEVKSGQEAANNIKNEVEALKKTDPAIASKWQRAGERVGKYSAEKWQALKKLKGKLSWKNLVLYGLAGYGTYAILRDLFKDGKTEVLQDCVMNLEGSELSVTTGGDPVVLYRKDDLDPASAGHGGLKFYATGRVWTIDNTMSGEYSCTLSGELTAQVSENSLNEDTSSINITWDPAKTDDTKPPIPNPKPKVEPSYFDCSKRDITKDNLIWGCISPDLAKLQACYGITPSKGYFGPKTRARLGTDKITPEKYAKLMKEKNCYGSDTTSNVTTSDVINAGGGYKGGLKNKADLSKFGYLNGQSTDEPVSLSNQTGENPSETGKQLYNRLKSEGLILGDDAITYLEGGTSYGPSRRIKYKGPDLTPNQLMSLDDAISGLGYTRIKQKLEKRYGDKYVWVINK